MTDLHSTTIVVLEGDQTGQELLLEALRLLDPSVVRLPLIFEHFNLSLANRRQTRNQVIHQAAEAMRRTGFGLKAATITPESDSSSLTLWPTCWRRSRAIRSTSSTHWPPIGAACR